MFRKIALFIFCFCFGFGYIWNPLKPKIHIYIDHATTPALLQMTDFVRQPKRDKKFIFWRRFPNLSERINLSALNAMQIDLPQSEGANDHTKKIIKSSIQVIYEQNPYADYIIHSNLWWNETLVSVLQIIPSERIKQLHIYEDGVSNVIFSRKKYAKSINPEKYDYTTILKDILNGKEKYKHTYDFIFHTLYPTTYHFSFVDMMKQDADLQKFISFLNSATLKNIDYTEISHRLTKKQKETLFSLADFDIEDYKKQTAGKSVDFFLLRGAFTTIDEQVTTVSTLFKNYDKNRVLVLKEHPNLTKRVIAQKIQKNIPNTIIFPKHIPFEVLILANLMPDTISGYTTSVFFVIPPEKIKYFITAKKDSYLPFLKKLNIVSDNQIIPSMKEEND